jgi:hypothetical protein
MRRSPQPRLSSEVAWELIEAVGRNWPGAPAVAIARGVEALDVERFIQELDRTR